MTQKENLVLPILLGDPADAFLDTRNAIWRNAELASKFSRRVGARSDVLDLEKGEFCSPMFFTGRMLRTRFYFHVENVVALRSDEKVLWVDA